MTSRTRKLLIILGLVAFMSAGYVLGAGAQRKDDDSKGARTREYYDSLELFGRVYERISRNYVDELDPQELIDAAIEGMLEELDAHSQLLTPQSYDDLMTSTQGEFGGLGIQITVRDEWITVVSPIEGTPAYLMGIQGGDQIVEIEGETTEGWRTTDAVKKLRGPKGSDVTIGIRRPGEDAVRSYTITRDIIKLESIPYAFMIDDESKVGYVRITNFARTTVDELKEALSELEAAGMERLLVDLRYNPGGLLTAAKDVSELFLEQGDLIVYTKGRYMRNNLSYYSTGSNGKLWDQTPLVVLINGSSASASEILAGAIQDHDVGLVLGRTSFGKGSVQTVFDLPPDKALKLTTARYYTPSGRSIHRERLRSGELAEEEALMDGMELEGADEDVEITEPEIYFTDMGREVYGGGGISPDIKVEPSLLSDAEVCLERDGIFFSYATGYAIDHEELANGFEVSDAMVEEFYLQASERENLQTYLTEFELEWSRELMEENLDYVKSGILRELERRYHGAQDAYQVSIQDDGQLWEAVDLLRQADTRLDLFRVAEEYNARKLAEVEAEAESEEQEAGVN